MTVKAEWIAGPAEAARPTGTAEVERFAEFAEFAGATDAEWPGPERPGPERSADPTEPAEPEDPAESIEGTGRLP